MPSQQTTKLTQRYRPWSQPSLVNLHFRRSQPLYAKLVPWQLLVHQHLPMATWPYKRQKAELRVPTRTILASRGRPVIIRPRQARGPHFPFNPVHLVSLPISDPSFRSLSISFDRYRENQSTLPRDQLFLLPLALIHRSFVSFYAEQRT